MPLWACATYKHQSEFPESSQQIPLFHSIVDDKALIMAAETRIIRDPVMGHESEQTVFNYFYCDRFQRFDRNQEPTYKDSRQCLPLSPIWLPLKQQDPTGRELVQVFAEQVVDNLRASLEKKQTQDMLDPFYIVIDGALEEALLGTFVTSTLVLAYKMPTATSRWGRFLNNGMKAGGWLAAIGIGLSIGSDVAYQRKQENIYQKDMQELNALINSIDEETSFNAESDNRPVIYVFEELKQAIEKSVDAILYQHCGFA